MFVPNNKQCLGLGLGTSIDKRGTAAALSFQELFCAYKSRTHANQLRDVNKMCYEKRLGSKANTDLPST